MDVKRNKIFRRISIINDTKIKYLSVLNKIYEVTNINWLHSSLEAKETDLSVGDVPESELWNVAGFADFKIRLVNGNGVAKVADFGEWKERNKKYGSK